MSAHTMTSERDASHVCEAKGNNINALSRNSLITMSFALLAVTDKAMPA